MMNAIRFGFVLAACGGNAYVPSDAGVNSFSGLPDRYIDCRSYVKRQYVGAFGLVEYEWCESWVMIKKR